MAKLAAVLLALVVSPAWGQTIEGYWQDSARRILFSPAAPAGYKYGQWTALDPEQTYPSAKYIRRSAAGFEVDDLLYDDQEVVKVLAASESDIEFTRTTRWSGCSVHHRCGLEPDGMLCALRTSCGERLVWQGEERYVRRASCERRQPLPEAQGIPVVCR